ncbi:MAG: glycoside hydrolase, partial [Bacteroidales bacterium]|nr:glycoside hydrolase [Candidatus Cacconaster merdequi]
TDTHTGYAESLKTWEQMLECEMIPFKKGIEKGAKMIMTAHIAAPNVTRDNLPATLSKVIITDKLRGELGFDGIVVTDAIEMGAITNHYTVEESTINAVLAGVDIILLPTHYEDAFNALSDAVSKGIITEERITQSARRIVELKKSILRERGVLAE